MMFAFLVGSLCTLIAASLIRPFLATRHRPGHSSRAGTQAPQELLRQLRDLDDDLAAGRILESDHRRLRGPLELRAADALHARDPMAAERHRPVAQRTDRDAGRSVPAGRARGGLAVAVASLAVVAIGALLLGAVEQRAPGTVVTARPAGSAPSAGDGSAGRPAAVEVALRKVRSHPRQASAHVELARAYTEARQPQLAAVEYLAATRLDPGNAEADTALALVAFKAGSARQADALVTRALAEHPGYPEALYTRGLIRAMGLHHPAAATRDLRAYQHAAPHGSHRTTVATVLALISSGAIE
jgi:tetratricopeptide (TPR) repeat protein